LENINIDPEVFTKLPDSIPLFGGMPITNTLVTALIASVILIVAAFVIRFVFFKKFKQLPHGLQNVLEIIVDGVSNYTNSKVGETTGNQMAPYIFTLAAFICCNGLLELFAMGKLRPAPSDLNETTAFALITFFLIRFFAYKKGGVIGRIRHYAHPSPIIAPVMIFVDLVTPVSLACRMFGNLLGGLVVMELLYSLGIFSFVIPGLAASFFTVFHTCMQAFIFITLSLAFVEEALE
jgi:F-type H+-transporting ATPase subunit a